MTTRTMTARFFGAAKRMSKDPWPGCLPPLDEVGDGIDALHPPDDLVELPLYTVVGRVRAKLDDYLHLVFYRIRQDVLPSLRDASTGDIDTLDLDGDSDLAEATEVLMFKSGLVVQLVNRDGPGINAIARYIEEVSGVDIDMVALINDDALAQLGKHPELQMVRIRAASGSEEQLAQGHESLRGAGESADRAPGTKSVELLYRAEPAAHDTFSTTWMPRLTKLLGRPGIERVAVTAFNANAGMYEEKDLLQDRITTKAFVELTTDNRHITEEAARDALLTAYNGMAAVVDPALGALIDEELAEAVKIVERDERRAKNAAAKAEREARRDARAARKARG